MTAWLWLGALSACRPVATDGEVGVPVTAAVVVEFAPNTDSRAAHVRWNVLGRNGRIAVHEDWNNDRVRITPITAVPYGTEHEVVVDGLVDWLSGDPLPPIVKTFRTLRNPVVYDFDVGSSQAGSGRRCDIDPVFRRPTACYLYGAGLGEDGLPGTDDDPVRLRYDYLYDGEWLVARTDTWMRDDGSAFDVDRTVFQEGPRGTPLASVTNAGGDDILNTPDDRVDYTTEAVVGEHGFVTHLLTVNSRGSVYGGVRYLLTDQGDLLGEFEIESEGSDREYGTEDDCVEPGWLGTVDASGRLVSEHFIDETCDVFGKETTVLGTRYYLYDPRGALQEVVLIQDDRITDTFTYDYTTRGLLRGVVAYDGDPGLWPDDRLPVDQRVDRTFAAGLRESERTFGSPGPDGLWFTNDDLLTREIAFFVPEGP